MALSDFPNSTFHLFPRWSPWPGGEGGYPTSSDGVRPFEYFPAPPPSTSNACSPSIYQNRHACPTAKGSTRTGRLAITARAMHNQTSGTTCNRSRLRPAPINPCQKGILSFTSIELALWPFLSHSPLFKLLHAPSPFPQTLLL